jgi:hypothetical protein
MRWMVGLMVFAGCDEVVTACTLIGCENGFTLELVDADGQPLDGLAGEIVVDGVALPFDCADASGAGNASSVSCADNAVSVWGSAPEMVTITALVGGVDATAEVSLTYAEVTPNGEECPPVCSQASATVELLLPL